VAILFALEPALFPGAVVARGVAIVSLPHMSTLPALTLAKDLRQAIERGHPWIYDRAVARAPAGLQPGELVAVVHGRERLAVAYADPGRAIAARVLELHADARIDERWVRERAARAGQCRRVNPGLAHTNAFRAIHGENDFMPGLVVDVYDDTGVVVFDGLAAATFWSPYLDAVLSGLATAGIELARLWALPIKAARGVSQYAGAVRGHAPAEVIVIHEHGAEFEVDVRRGQKTGLFLDQRDNRRLVGELAAGARVLNLFAYTGGFSVHAALGGARRVISVDSAAPAMAAAARNFARNGLDPEQHEFVAGDAFAFLEQARDRGERYDLVILDPPSFAPSERTRARGLSAYRTLNGLALAIVEPGGLFMSASCSSHVTEADLIGVVGQAALQSRRRVRILDIRGAASDHPVLPAFPEGRYLSFLVLYVE
jgi:23S rRNA (cytosine1962-C5)-methyltransferase